MLLAIDIGNTNITIGVFDGERIVATWRTETDVRKQADEYALLLSGLLPMKDVATKAITDVVLCSVVPPLTSVFHETSRFLFDRQPLVLGTGTRTGVRIRYDNPRDVGADRIADCAAAFHLYGGPSIVVDFGTATVFDAISADGEYLGGSIALGVGVAAETLYSSTSQLRRVDLVAPPTAIGRNTAQSMQSGLIFGYAGLIEAMVRRFRQEMDAPKAIVIGTGGLAPVIAKQTDVFNIVDQNLTLQGLRMIHEFNARDEDPPAAARGTS